MRLVRSLSLVLVPLLIASCTRCTTTRAASGGATVMSYNLQTLFDPVDQGGEYKEFRVSTGAWNQELYRARLAALASAILSSPPPEGWAGGRVGPDILVVQEAENARVLRDLADELGGYRHIASSPDEDAVLACGILSRYPFTAIKAHRIRQPEAAPSSVPRFMLEVELNLDGRQLVIIVAHLKSKLGGAEQTEPERRAAAAFASALIAGKLAGNPSLAIIVAGDFNENPDEHARTGRAYPTALMAPDAGPGTWLRISGDRNLASSVGQPVLYCPWDDYGGYSYRFDGQEERIDQLLMSSALVSDADSPLQFSSFSAQPPAFAVDAYGTPIRWDSRLAGGYSDHLPIRVSLVFVP